MKYSVHFFGIAGRNVADQFRIAAQVILNRMEQQIRSAQRFDEEEIRNTLAKAATIGAGQLPDDCDAGYFDAVCWLADVTGERINIGSFIGFKSLSFLTDAGIWPLLLQSRPEFSVPVCSDPPPQIGFLGNEDIQHIAIPSIAQLPSAQSAEAAYARQEFQEVLESLDADKLDLLAVLI